MSFPDPSPNSPLYPNHLSSEELRIDADRLEAAARVIARRILEAAAARSPTPLGPEWARRSMMRWTAEDPWLRTRLFRFIDALPTLASRREVTKHLREYLLADRDERDNGAERVEASAPAGRRLAWRALRLALRAARPGTLLGDAAAGVARMNAAAMARGFIAGEGAGEVVAAVERLRRGGFAFSLDLLGEAVTSDAQAEEKTAHYIDLIERLSDAATAWAPNPLLDAGPGGAPLPRVNVSVKLSSLEAHFEPVAFDRARDAAAARLRLILRAARRRGAFVNIDMEQFALKGLVQAVFKTTLMEPEFRDFADAGIVLQAYLRDSAADLEDLIAWARARGTDFWVRLVKGAYWDAETILSAQRGWPCPVFTQKWETDANFERLAARLLDAAAAGRAARDGRRGEGGWGAEGVVGGASRRLGGIVHPAFAGHNARSLASAAARAAALGLDPRDYEFQTLFGMGDDVRTALAGMGHRVRVYTPHGPLIPGMSYLIRRLLENTSNESFVMRAQSDAPIEALLANPAVARPPSPPPPGEVWADPEDVGWGGMDDMDGMDGMDPGENRGEQDAGKEKSAKGEEFMRPESRGTSTPRTSPIPSIPSISSIPPAPRFRNEPLTDFSIASNRESMRAAIARARRGLGAEWPPVIAGERARPAEWLVARNPSRMEEVLGRVGLAGAEQADAAVRAAARAWPGWRRRPVRERADTLRRAADIMNARRVDLAAWMTLEVGKPWVEADGEVCEAVDFLRFYAAEMERLDHSPRRRDAPGETNRLLYEPRGVAAVIAPWNFPLAILTGMTAAALAAGNTVVVKPAEQSSIIAARLFEILEEAGVPPGAANLLPGAGEVVGPRLLENPEVALIAFTGSRGVGLSLIEGAARVRPGQRLVKRVLAEMGGKNAIIVDADADLDEAVAGIARSAFGFAGQKCSACSRVIALEPVADELARRLAETALSLPVGPADDPATLMGPLIDRAARENSRGFIERGRAEARVLIETPLAPQADPERGWFLGPVIFENVPPASALAREEIFGPVLALMRARDFNEAIELANDSDYGLTGGLFSRGPAHIALAMRELRVGNLYINRGVTGAMVDRQPFGGMGLSGVGAKAGGPDYLRQFCDAKCVTENTLRHGFAPAPGE